MTFICPQPDFDPLEMYETYEEKLRARERLRETVRSVQESLLEAQKLQRRNVCQRNRIITFRLPNEQLVRLDTVASDAATTRGHLLRQIIATYLSYVDDCEIKYNGSLI
jgi:hypothetical protein